jgi:hypothetical protein
MPEAYFSPWQEGLERDCRTCRYSIGQPDGIHLWCERHRLVVVFPCGWWEREAGADQKEESPHAAGFLAAQLATANPPRRAPSIPLRARFQGLT